MEVITTLTLEDVQKILLDEMRHWRMHFKTTLNKWLTMVGCRAIEKETGGGTFVDMEDKGGKEFDYCGFCNVISNAIGYGKDQKVLFYWSFNTAPDEYTLTNIDAPDTLKWSANSFWEPSHEDKDKPFCRETEISICKLAQNLGREPHNSDEKRPIERWLIEGAKSELTKECGGWFEVELDKTAFPICTLEKAINVLHRANLYASVSFIYGKNEEHKQCTVTKVILPQSLEDALKDEDTDKCQLPKLKDGEVVITSKRKLYINFKTCARYMAFVKETDDDNRMLEGWIIDACLPIIKKDCNDADLYSVEWLPFTGVDKFICKAEATGILLESNRFPKGSQIVIEYEYDPKGIVIHAPKIATEDGRPTADLFLYSEPITCLPKDRWIEVPRKEKLIPSDEIIEGFWYVKSDKVMAYHEWLMCAAGTAMQINLGGADVRTNWNENEAPITWHDALEKLMADCDSSNEFKVTYSLEHLLEDRGAYSYRQLNIYSCEPVKK